MIMVTGASGRFSSAVLAELRARGIPAVGGSRTPSAGQRHVDFSVPDSLDFNGVDTLLLVPAGAQEDDRQGAFHRPGGGIAARDGVSHLVYTSLTGAGDHLSMALPHRVTERIIIAGGMTWTILRNGVYAEILGAPLSWERQQEEPARIVSPLGDGAVAAVARQDLARAAASVLSDPSGHGERVYELVGSRAVSAADVAGRLGCEVRDIGLGEYRQLLAGGGMPAFRQSLMLSIASVIRHGFLAGTGDDLPNLLGGAPTDPLAVAAEALAARRVVVPYVACSRGRGYEPTTYPTNARKAEAPWPHCRRRVRCEVGAGVRKLVSAGGVELQLTCNDRGAPRRRPGRSWPVGRRRRR